MGVFQKWSQARDAKKQAEFEARLAASQGNFYNKPTALIQLPTPAWERYEAATFKAWHQAASSEELLRFYTTRFPPQFLEITNEFYRVARGSDIPFLHYNLAQVISRTMAQLVFAKEPQILVSCEDKKDKEACQKLSDDIWQSNDKQNFLTKCADLESYSGAVGIKMVLDTQVSEFPIFQAYPKEELELRRRYGRIYEICFKDYYPIDGETNPFVLYSVYGFGYIRYEMYQEKWNPASNSLEMTEVSLDSVPACRGLREIKFYGPNGEQSDIMFAVYKENKQDARSDYYGVIDDFEFLDELYSNMADYMRKSKIKTYLHDNAISRNAGDPNNPDSAFVPDSYDTSNIRVPDSNPNWQESEIKRDVIDPKSAFEGYTDLFERTLSKTLSTVGLSVNTVLMNMDSIDLNRASGAALSIREKASIRTRADKIARWATAISAITAAAAAMAGATPMADDSGYFVTPAIMAQDIRAVFPEYGEVDPDQKMDIMIKQLNAGLMTKEEAIRELHPDMDDDEISAEMKKLEDDAMEKAKIFAMNNPQPKPFGPKDALSKSKKSDDKGSKKA